MKKILFLTLILFLQKSTTFSQTPESKHFTIQKITDGVYAAIAKSGGSGFCNAGIIDMGEFTLVFDPFMTPEAAEDLKKAAKQLTGHEVRYVVNSHFHTDHTGGNQVFKGATIISTETTRELIEKNQPDAIADAKKNAPARLAELKNKDVSKMTPHEADENKMWKGYYEGLGMSADSFKMVLPDVTFIDRLVVYGTSRRALLMSYGAGHTESDLFLYLPSEQIAFLGDLLFVQTQPWMKDGNTDKWSVYLTNVSGLNIKTLIPGHGPVGTMADIDALKSYFKKVDEVAADYNKKGKSPEDDATLKSPAPYDNWFLSDFYKSNVATEYNRLYKKKD